MTVLTHEEAKKLRDSTCMNDPLALIHATEQAVLAKLAQGVSVEPEKMGVREVDWNEFEPVYGYSEESFNTAIAAARVAENERLACEFDKLYTIGGDEIGPAIRALIGGST